MEPMWKKTASKVQNHRDQGLQHIEPPLPDLPSPLPKNVVELPQQLLSPREVEITRSSPDHLISHLAAGHWSCEEVTRSFLGRAALSQKLVSAVLLPRNFNDSCSKGQLCYRVTSRAGFGSCSGIRLLLEGEAATYRSAARPSDQCKRTYRDERSDMQRWVCLLGGQRRCR